MTTLKFTLSNNNCQLDIKINSQPVKFTLVDNVLTIYSDITYGIHNLTFRLLNPQNNNIRIETGSVDDVDFRQTLYMMFAVRNNQRIQTTTLTTEYDELNLPFGNPMSWWQSTCAEKIPNGYYAQGMYEHFEIYYPESIIISDKHPKLVQDFFKINMDFHVHPKNLLQDPYYNTQVPYASLPKKIEFDEAALFEELMLQLPYLKETSRVPSQHFYNKTSSPVRWLTNDLIRPDSDPADYSLESKFSIDRSRVPILYSIFEKLNLDIITHAFLGILGPKEFISIHMDDYTDYKFMNMYKGCSQIYIPINFKLGNFFKLNKVGLLPTTEPILINNHNFSHALINDSDEYRFGLAIVGSPLK
jgi:hypothetical protein